VPITGGSAPTKLSGPLTTNSEVAKHLIGPDGAVVIYSAGHGVADYRFELYAVSIAGGVVARLNHALAVGETVSTAKIVPDGSTVVYLAGALGKLELYRTSLDGDGDALGDACDCAPADAVSWALPGEATDIVLSRPGGPAGPTILGWSPPAAGGLASGFVYDVIRSENPAEFVAGASCLETDAGPDTTASDMETPTPGGAFFYRVRAENACGVGIAGLDSNGAPQAARSCP
jgi:hypothetical protein